MNRILPFIDGIASVAQIAQLADTDLGLTRKAIAHLLYYKCVLLLDIFQFGAIYAPTAEIGAFIEDDEAQEECVRYISISHLHPLGDIDADNSKESKTMDKITLVQLYASLRQGLTLKNWCLEHSAPLKGIDVRRFITFGLIRGFLYRVHKYIIAHNVSSSFANTQSFEDDTHDIHALSVVDPESRRPSRAPSEIGEPLPLAKFLDGRHCFDEICTELQSSERRVLEKIRGSYGDVRIIHR
jgi:hypothetical protein